MENNRPKTTFRTQQSRKFSTAKFKQLKLQYNQLQSKYDIYNKSSPNNYEQNLDNLKAYHIKNNIKTLQLPGIDYLLQQMKNIPIDTGTNLRDFNIHPSTIQKYGAKFRNLISDQQQMKDFIQWFKCKQNQILKRNSSATQKFYLKQSLIASGFNQIITHIAHISKSRSQILRVLWNKQNKEVQQVFNLLHRQNSDFQKKNLQTIKQLHLGYQQQLISLRNQNCTSQKKLEQAIILNQSCLNSLRTMKKQIKKYEKIIKQLNESNNILKQQNFQLLQSNIQLTVRQHNVPLQQASLLSYQMLQMNKMKKNMKKGCKIKHLFKDIKNKAEAIVEKSELVDLEQKKDKLISFIKTRIQQNPNQKSYVMKGQFSDEDNQDIQLGQNIQEILNNKGLQNQLRSKITKGQNFFSQKGVNTQNQIYSQMTENLDVQSIAVQTIPCINTKETVTNLLKNMSNEEKQGRAILEKKKTEQRHSIMLLQISKIMEFKKIENSSRMKRVSNMTIVSNHNNIQAKKQRFTSQFDSQSDIAQEAQQIQAFDSVNTKHEAIEIQLKKRQQNFIRKHHQSLLTEKSTDFKNMMSILTKQLQNQKSSFASKTPQLSKQFLQSDKKITKMDQFDQKISDIKGTVRKYIQSKTIQKQPINNPEKHLKKFITDTFRNLFVSKRTNVLKQMLRTTKHNFGNITYQNKLIHLITMIIQNKDKSLLSAITILLAIPQLDGGYTNINLQDVNQLYCKIYFFLTIKSPVQNQFNIWGNYTNLHKLNSSGFIQILRNYFSESKCLYLQLKIRQLAGISTQNYDCDDNVSYVQLNPLMMYLLQVYLLQKQNYYQSYHQIIQFVSEGNYIQLQTFILLLDLLCIKQQQQKIIINKYFNTNTNTQKLVNQNQINKCHKDIFYRICVKYQFPLFQFIKILKLEQFKILQICLQNQFNDLSDQQKWKKTKHTLEHLLKAKNKYNIGFNQIINILDRYVQESFGLFNQSFLFFYRIVVHAACT